MADLATTADLEARLGRDLTADEAARAPALLADASALVREWTRQDFDQAVADTVILRPVGAMLRLPQRPVTAVSDVHAVDCDGQPDIELSGWCWDGSDKIDLIEATPTTTANVPQWWWSSGPDTYQVTYDHGYAETPAVVVATVSAMVLRTLLSPSMTPGMVSERIGAYNYQLQQGAGSSGAAVTLTSADEKALARYRRRAGTIQVRAG